MILIISRNQICTSSSKYISKTSIELTNLIKELQFEDSQLTNKISPNDVSIISNECHKKLYSIISTYESIKLSSCELVNKKCNMYLNTSKPYKIDGNYARIIEYGKKKADEGSFTKVYLQWYDDKTLHIKELITNVTNCTQIAKIINADIYKFLDSFYAVVGNEAYNVDKSSRFLNLVILKYSHNESTFIKINDPSYLSMVEIIDKYVGEENIAADYSFSMERFDNGIKLLVKDKKGSIVNNQYLDFTNEYPEIK